LEDAIKRLILSLIFFCNNPIYLRSTNLRPRWPWGQLAVSSLLSIC